MTENISDFEINPGDGDFYARLGRAVRELRVSRGVSADVLAKHIGVDIAQLQKYEDGQIAMPIYHFLPIAQFFDYPDELNKLG